MSLFSFDGIVTWIVNPNHFYIQLSTDTDRKCNVEYLIRNLVKNNELENPGFDLQLDLPYSEFDDNQDCVQSPFIDPWANDDDNEEADVEPLLDKGDYVLARSRKIREPEFLRGKIEEKMKNDILGWCYLIFFIDVGQRQWVHIEDIRLIPEQLRMIDELAHKCMLQGIHPNYLIGDGWSEESKDLFRDLCEYKGTPCRFQSNLMPDLYRTNIVDLCTEVATKTMSEWVNVKEYMINLGYGQLQPTRLTSKARIDARNEMRELPSRLETPDQFLVTGSATAVQLSYCLDPGLFYVHPLSIAGPGLSELHRMESNMMQEMNDEFWSSVQNSLNSTNFWKGQLCAFRYDKSEREYDNRIYRVLIEKISRKLGMFQIFSIDYGWRQICKTTNLVPLCSIFVTQYPSCMATRVRLFDLQPSGRCWPDEAYEEMLKYQDQDLFMYVVEGETPVSSVILFECKSEHSCINDILEETEWCEAANSEGADEKFEIASKTVWKYMHVQKQRKDD